MLSPSRHLEAVLLKLKAELTHLSGRDRQASILRFIAELTKSRRVALLATTPLGVCIGALAWPPLDPLQPLFGFRGPAYRVLACCDEIWERVCTQQLNTAFRIDSGVVAKSAAYKLIYRLCRHDYIMAYALPDLPNGNRLFVCAMRAKKPCGSRINPAYKKFISLPHESSDNDYTDTELGTFGEICDAFATELSATSPEGLNAPMQGYAEPLTLNADFTFTKISPYLRALLTRFYGPLQPPKNRRFRLPFEMEQRILEEQNASLHQGSVLAGAASIPLRKKQRGRVLFGCWEPLSNGCITLRLAEMPDYHSELRRIAEECRQLSGSFARTVFRTCLILAEGVRARNEIAKQLGLLGNVETPSFNKVHSRAKGIVAGGSVAERVA